MKLKKILAVVSALAVLGVGIPCENFNVLNDFTVSVSAEELTLENGLKYEVYLDETITITGYDGTVAEVEIPAEIDGLPVTYIGNYAFDYCELLTSVIIPDSVTSIGDYAFNCCNLKEITIPSSVVYCGYGFVGHYSINLEGICGVYKINWYRKEPWTVNIENEVGSYGICKVEDFTIYGYTGSIIEIYANVNGFNFVSIGTMPSEQPTGDIDGDSETTSNDALNILQIVANTGEFTEEQKALADLDGDGEITSLDALIVLQMIVGLE